MNKVEQIKDEIKQLEAIKAEWEYQKIKDKSPYSLYRRIMHFIEPIHTNFPLASNYLQHADAYLGHSLLLQHNNNKTKQEIESFKRWIEDTIKGFEILIEHLENELTILS